MAMIREVGRGEGVALDYPGGREVVVYLDRIVSASRAVFRYVSRTVGEETEEVTWTLAEDDVQSPHVSPAISLPSALEPVRTSCWTGEGDPAHWPLMRWPRSSRKTAASPRRACRAARSLATMTPAELNQGPLPIRLRASVGALPLSASRSTLR